MCYAQVAVAVGMIRFRVPWGHVENAIIMDGSQAAVGNEPVVSDTFPGYAAVGCVAGCLVFEVEVLYTCAIA